MPEAPMEIQFEPKTLIIATIVMIILIILLLKGKKD